MRCEVLLFAHLREAIGRARIAIDLPANATVADALNELARQHASIAALQASLAVAVDQQYQSPTAPLHDGCTIALIPPVSGG